MSQLRPDCVAVEERRRITSMRVVKGGIDPVENGESAPEGRSMDVLEQAAEPSDFVLTTDMRNELRDASEAMKRGEVVEMDDVLAEIERA